MPNDVGLRAFDFEPGARCDRRRGRSTACGWLMRPVMSKIHLRDVDEGGSGTR